MILRYGIVAGIVVAVPMNWSMLTLKPGDPMPGMLVGYLCMLIGLSAVFLGIRQQRDRALGGVIKFGNAFVLGLGITAVASLIYAFAWELSLAVSGFDFTAYYAEAMVKAAHERGGGAAELQKAAADAEAFTRMYRNPLLRFLLTFLEMFPVGILVSLISAALLRNSRFLPARTSSP